MKVWKNIVSLPFFPDLENKKINYIINCLNKFDKFPSLALSTNVQNL